MTAIETTGNGAGQTRKSKKEVALRDVAIALFTLVSQLRKLMQRTINLSLNAEVSCAHMGKAGDAFSVVAQELRSVISRMDGVLRGMEASFQSSSTLFGRNARNRWFCNKVNNSLENIKKNYRQSLEASMEGGEDSLNHANGNCNHLNQILVHLQQSALKGDSAMLKEMTSIRKQLDFLNWVAVRQSHFLAVFGRVEAARVAGTDTHNLGTVAAEMSLLAEDMKAVEMEARKHLN